MEHLHAYWRMEYVAQEKAPKDRRPFVDLPKSDDDKANLIVSREPFTFILMNRYPYNAGHLLVLPYREVADIEDLNKDEQNCFLESTIKAKRLLTAAIKPDGFNIGVNLGEAGGAGVLSTCTYTSFRDGMATPTSCPSWAQLACCHSRWRRCGIG